MEGSEVFAERERESQPKIRPYSFKEIFPEEDVESEKIQYLRALADARLIALQNCNKGLNRLGRQNRRLKREKTELAVIIGDLEFSLLSRGMEK